MASRSKLYFILALGFNCFVITFSVLDSRSLGTFDINFDLVPTSWDQYWSKSPSEPAEQHHAEMSGHVEEHRVCGMCTANATLCEELGEDKLGLAIWNRGTELRLKRFIAKARRGEGFTVGVVGGSGHGLNILDLHHEKEINTPLNMNRAIFDHLNTLFPAKDGVVIGQAGGNGKNGFVNGAQGGTGTEYFSMCFGEHVPEEMDLVLVDLSINDELITTRMTSYELLVRGLLDLPNEPAIINLHIFALFFRQIAFGGDMHAGINQFYDIPTISLRGPFLHEVLADVEKVKEFFVMGTADHHNEIPQIPNTDLRHLSATGHRRMAELVKAYIDWKICDMGDTPAGGDVDAMYPIPPLPRQMLTQKYDPDVIIPSIRPMCLSTNGLKHKLEPIENEGWENWNWKNKHYLRATKPNSQIAFSFNTSLGTVQLHYLRSAIFGLGSVKCWVDDEVEKAVVIEGYWKEIFNIGRSTTIRDDLNPGDHLLRCELLGRTADPGGGTEFRIISVMSI